MQISFNLFYIVLSVLIVKTVELAVIKHVAQVNIDLFFYS